MWNYLLTLRFNKGLRFRGILLISSFAFEETFSYDLTFVFEKNAPEYLSNMPVALHSTMSELVKYYFRLQISQFLFFQKKIKGLFGNVLRANYSMNLFETFSIFYWIAIRI